MGEQEHNFRWSECGVDFDEYVRRCHDPLGSGPASREVPDLWPGRRCQLYARGGERREATVVVWSQWASVPRSYATKWSLQLSFAAPGRGDVVTIQGLKAAKQYNGMQGVVGEWDGDQGRFAIGIALEGGSQKRLAVKLGNICRPMQDLYVKRMNVAGGGILHALGVRDPPMLSLEWLEPAAPAVDLDDGITVPSCPTCRAIEPAIAAFQEAKLTPNEEECPVCLERKTCRTLKCCSHVVCDSCWTEWRRTTSSCVPELLVNARPDDHSAAAPRDDGDEGTARDRAELYRYLAENANGGEDGLRRFRDKIAVTSVARLLTDGMRTALLPLVPIPALDIFLHAMESRLDDIAVLKPKSMAGSSVVPADFFFNDVALVCCTRIGEQYEQMLSFRGAISWYERGLLYSKRIADARTRALCLTKCYCNLGLAQKHNSFYDEAEKSYQSALKLDRNNFQVLQNLEVLQEEIKMWTGTSGKLTPSG